MATVRPAPIESLEAYKHLSPDSGFPITIHPNYNPKIKAHVPPDPPHKEFKPLKDRGSYADPEKKTLFAVAKPVDLTESIGTLYLEFRSLSLYPWCTD
jgi:sulfonate dioxygenase